MTCMLKTSLSSRAAQTHQVRRLFGVKGLRFGVLVNAKCKSLHTNGLRSEPGCPDSWKPDEKPAGTARRAGRVLDIVRRIEDRRSSRATGAARRRSTDMSQDRSDASRLDRRLRDIEEY